MELLQNLKESNLGQTSRCLRWGNFANIRPQLTISILRGYIVKLMSDRLWEKKSCAGFSRQIVQGKNMNCAGIVGDGGRKATFLLFLLLSTGYGCSSYAVP